jgi:hypothetical protein
VHGDGRQPITEEVGARGDEATYDEIMIGRLAATTQLPAKLSPKSPSLLKQAIFQVSTSRSFFLQIHRFPYGHTPNSSKMKAQMTEHLDPLLPSIPLARHRAPKLAHGKQAHEGPYF